MKKKKLLTLLLTLAMGVTTSLAFVACDSVDNGQLQQTEIEKVYAQYVIHAEAEGKEPLSYEEWLESIKGQDGVDGEDGIDGEDGKSAYEIWLDNGNEGTEEDFLNWLKDGESHTYGEWVALYVGDEYCNEAFFYRTCSDCAKMEWKQGKDADHVWGEDYAHNKTYHWIECEACDSVKDEEEHSVDSEGVCVICHAEIKDSVVVHEAVPYDGSKVTITFYHTMGQMYQSILNEYIPVFNAMYPNITVEHDMMGDYDSLRNQITTELTAGNSPSLAYCYPDHVALYNKSNAVVSLDDYILSDAAVTRAGGTTETMGYTQAQLNDFIPAFFEEGKAYGDGKMYTLPIMKSTEVLYYNKTVFEENGWTVPTTWAEMETLCAKIKAKYPNDIPFGYDSESNWFITMAEQFGSPYTSPTKGEYFLFNNETNRKFVELFRTWYQNGYFTTEKIYGNYTSNLFKETNPEKQKIYMCIGSSAGATYQCPALTKLPVFDDNGQPVIDPATGAQKEVDGYPFEVGIATIPQMNPSNPKVIQQGPSVCLFKKSNPQEEAAAWLFAKFLTTNVEYQALVSMNNGYTPVIQSVQQHPVYADFLAQADGNVGPQQVKATAVRTTLAQMKAYYVSPAFVGSSAAREKVGALLQTCLVTPLGGKTAAQLIQEQFDAAIKALEYDYGK